MPTLKVEFVYAGLRVRNLARSLRFYRKLGFQVHKRGRMEHRGEWVHLKFPGALQRLELNYYPPGTRFYEPIRRGTEFDHLGFRASSISGVLRRLERLRIPVAVRVQETHENLVYVKDPDGNWVEFFGPVEPTPPQRPRRKRSA